MVCFLVPQTVRFGVLSCEKGTHRAGWVWHAFGAGALWGWVGRTRDRIVDRSCARCWHADCCAGRIDDLSSRGPARRERRVPTQGAEGARHRECRAPVQRACTISLAPRAASSDGPWLDVGLCFHAGLEEAGRIEFWGFGCTKRLRLADKANEDVLCTPLCAAKLRWLGFR